MRTGIGGVLRSVGFKGIQTSKVCRVCAQVVRFGCPGMSPSEPPEQTGVAAFKKIRSGGSPSLHPGHPPHVSSLVDSLDIRENFIRFIRNDTTELFVQRKVFTN